VIEQNHDAGVRVLASDVTLESTVVRGTVPDPQDRVVRGVDIQALPHNGSADVLDRATIHMHACTVEQNSGAGMAIVGSDATIESSIVRAGQPRKDGTFGRGISVQSYRSERSVVSITASVIDDNAEVGVFVSGSDATIGRTLIRATAQTPAGNFGDGVAVASQDSIGASVGLQGSRIESSDRAGVSSFAGNATIDTTTFECNAVDLDGENQNGASYAFSMAAGVVCGCSGKSAACQVANDSLASPAVLTPVGP
jgi:hypothetical protein